MTSQIERSQTASKEVDAFTQHVMSNIDPAIFKSLNLVQLEAIRSAISANAPFKRHPVDIRVVIPLFFVRLYCVFLIGRDKRHSVRTKEQARKLYTQGLSLGMVIYTGLALLLPIALILLYLLKSLLGIDIFPDQHVTDFLP